MNLRPPKGLAELALVLVSVIVSCVNFEAGYRIWLAYGLHHSAPSTDSDKASNFSAVDASFLREDRQSGFRFNRGSHDFLTAYVKDGSFDRCETLTFRADRPDASGPLPRDPADADLRILVFGDSFTAVQWNDETWPSLMQRALEDRLGIRVSVLNLARFGFGVLQMLDYAAQAVSQMRPDAYIVAYITNDLIRTRFWLLERHIRGRDRIVTSPDPEIESDPRISAKVSDYYQINPSITKAWCDRMTAAKSAGQAAAPGSDPVMSDLRKQRLELLSDYNQPLFRVNFWTLGASFAWNRIVYGNAFRNMKLMDARGAPTAIDIDDFGEDAGFRQAIASLRETGIPGYLVHIPHQFEILEGEEFDYPRAGGVSAEQGEALKESLEKLMGSSSILLLGHLDAWRADPAAHIWKPDDFHPNRKGIEVLSKAIADALIEQGIAALARNCAPGREHGAARLQQAACP